MQLSRFGFGVTGSLDVDLVRELAPMVEAAGFRTLWFNDTPGGDALLRIGAAARVTSSLQLGTGVIPVDRRPVGEIVAAIEHHHIPPDRLTIGIGSSATPSPLTRVRDAMTELRGHVSVPLYVGALGPKMRAVAAAEADGLLVNWLTPDAARVAQEDKARDEATHGATPTSLALYIRTALGAAAGARLAEEAKRYSTIPSYAANFTRLGITALDASVRGSTGAELARGLDPFTPAVDEPIIRAITAEDTIQDYALLIAAIATS